MKILFISRWFPYPPDNGSKIRIYNLLRQLSLRHEVYLVSFADQGEAGGKEQAKLLEFCRRVEIAPLPKFQPKRIENVSGFFSTRPRSVVATDSAPMRALIDRLSGEQRFDLVIASQVWTAPYALSLTGVPKILEEVEISNFTDTLKRKESLPGHLRFWLTIQKNNRYIAWLSRQFQGMTVVSDRELQELHLVAPEYCCLRVIPNGIDLSFYSPNGYSLEPDSLVYNGALTYAANLDAMAYFLGDIFPLILKQRPQVKLYITGKLEGVQLNQLPLADPLVRQAVVFTGYLEDIRPRVARSWAAIVPIRDGGGTRLKILESLALGTPVVATHKGAEGLDLMNGQEILLADDPHEFAHKVLRLLEERSLRDRLSIEGQKAIAGKYDWVSIGQCFDQFLDEVFSEISVC